VTCCKENISRLAMKRGWFSHTSCVARSAKWEIRSLRMCICDVEQQDGLIHLILFCTREGKKSPFLKSSKVCVWCHHSSVDITQNAVHCARNRVRELRGTLVALKCSSITIFHHTLKFEMKKHLLTPARNISKRGMLSSNICISTFEIKNKSNENLLRTESFYIKWRYK